MVHMPEWATVPESISDSLSASLKIWQSCSPLLHIESERAENGKQGIFIGRAGLGCRLDQAASASSLLKALCKLARCHLPPAGDGMPRSFKAAIILRMDSP